MPIELFIRQITAEELVPLRYAILHPEASIDQQLQPFDHEPTTRHFGAFLATSQNVPTDLDEKYLPSASVQSPISCLTLVLADCTFPDTIPASFFRGSTPPTMHIQLRKFAVLEVFQGRGIGRTFFAEVLKELPVDEGPILLHLDSRRDMAGFYEKVGMERLSEEVFVKYGPTGNGKGVEHIKMGMLISK